MMKLDRSRPLQCRPADSARVQAGMRAAWVCAAQAIFRKGQRVLRVQQLAL